MYSEGEAEAVCNRLKQQGLVDGCITEDGDAFLFGAGTLIKNLSCDKQQHLNHITVYSGVFRGGGLVARNPPPPPRQ